MSTLMASRPAGTPPVQWPRLHLSAGQLWTTLHSLL